MSSHLKDKREYLRKEYEAYMSKQYAKGIVYFARALNKSYEKNPCYNLATTYYRRGDYRTAIKKYRLAHIIDSKSPMVYNAWGSCLSHLGRYDEAILKFKSKIFSLDSVFKRLNLLLWSRKFKNVLWKNLVFHLRVKKTLEIDANYGLAYLNWALVLFWQQKKDEAEKMVEEALKKTGITQEMIVYLYKMELLSAEESIAKADAEEEKVFLHGRKVGYNWMLEFVENFFMFKDLEDSELMM